MKEGITSVSILKIIVVGNSGTGKTSFVNRWTKNTFSETHKATITAEFAYKLYNDDRGKIYKIQLWDLAGQDKSINITKMFCRDSHGIVVISDITNKNSLEETVHWKKNIDESAKFMDGTDIPAILIENKIDLADKETLKNEKKIKEFCENYGYIENFKTSAKTGEHIVEAMDFLIKHIVKKIEIFNGDEIKKRDSSIVLDYDYFKDDIEKSKKKSTCC